MRTEEEITALIFSFALFREDIQAVNMAGSRASLIRKHDRLRDYDITSLVENVGAIGATRGFQVYFGDVMILQKPDDMALLPFAACR